MISPRQTLGPDSNTNIRRLQSGQAPGRMADVLAGHSRWRAGCWIGVREAAYTKGGDADIVAGGPRRSSVPLPRREEDSDPAFRRNRGCTACLTLGDSDRGILVTGRLFVTGTG